jgi:hypothetical protein
MFNDARLVKYELLERNRKTRANKSLQMFQYSLNCIDYAKLKDCVDLLCYDTVQFLNWLRHGNFKLEHRVCPFGSLYITWINSNNLKFMSELCFNLADNLIAPVALSTLRF